LKYSIIGSGFVSSILQAQIDNFVVYDRNNLRDLKNNNHDVIVLCAPTGYRLRVNADPDKDFKDCHTIVRCIKQSNFDKIIHLSTVDVFQNSFYGQNRKWIEEQLISDKRTTIIRLPSLIHPLIEKNILFDLSHRLWLEKISPKSKIQWYPMDNLFSDIKKTLDLEIKQNNFVSRPIENKELISILEPSLLNQILGNQVDSVNYDFKSQDNNYWIPDDKIWNSLQSCYFFMKNNTSRKTVSNNNLFSTKKIAGHKLL